MITCDPRIRSGWPCVAGTRIGVELVAEDIAAGETPEQYAADKGISVADVHEAIAVYEGMRPLFDAMNDRNGVRDVAPTVETREPRRGMSYRRKHGDGSVQVIRVFPWGRGHRVQWHYVGYPDERREESLTQFRRLFTKVES